MTINLKDEIVHIPFMNITKIVYNRENSNTQTNIHFFTGEEKPELTILGDEYDFNEIIKVYTEKKTNFIKNQKLEENIIQISNVIENQLLDKISENIQDKLTNINNSLEKNSEIVVAQNKEKLNTLESTLNILMQSLNQNFEKHNGEKLIKNELKKVTNKGNTAVNKLDELTLKIENISNLLLNLTTNESEGIVS
jgi:hypothetical protein